MLRDASNNYMLNFVFSQTKLVRRLRLMARSQGQARLRLRQAMRRRFQLLQR